MCFHRLKDKKNGFVESLESGSKMKIIEPYDKSTISPGIAYLAPSNYHLLIEPSRTFALSTEAEVNFSRPSIDLTFESAGGVFKAKPKGTSEEREAILKSSDDYIGKFATVEYEMLSKGSGDIPGIPQKPVMLGLRECDSSGNPKV